MKKFFLLFTFGSFCFFTNGFAQQKPSVTLPVKPAKSQSRGYTAELGLGAASYYGDLTQKAKLFDQPHPAASAGIAYRLSSRLQPSLSVSIMKIGADDKNNDRFDLKARNLSFRSLVWDLNLGLQVYLLKETTNRFLPYLYAGVGLFHFNPYTTDRTGGKQYLQPLGTEGQNLNGGKAYQLTQFEIPFGGGLGYKLTSKVQVKLDFLFRKTFTDYLDDVSTRYADPTQLAQQNASLPQLAFRGNEVIPSLKYPKPSLPRGNANEKDFYYTTLLKAAYRL